MIKLLLIIGLSAVLAAIKTIFELKDYYKYEYKDYLKWKERNKEDN